MRHNFSSSPPARFFFLNTMQDRFVEVPIPGTDRVLVLDAARLEYWRHKFFPHLLPTHGKLCIVAILASHQQPDPL